MSLVQDGPTQDVFTRVFARPVSSGESLRGSLFHLFWSAPCQGDRVVQVYVDGALYDVTMDAAQRSMILLLPGGVPHRIELLAVPATDAPAHLTDMLLGITPSVDAHAEIALLRDPGAGVGQRVCVDIAGELSNEAPLYGSSDARSGFGSVFGVGGFGFDAATGPGLGLGELGYGPLGADGNAWRWASATLPTGDHTLCLSIKDATGEVVSEPHDVDVEVTRLPLQADGLSLSPSLELSWS